MENQSTAKFLAVLQDPNFEAPFTPEQMEELTKAHVDHVRDLDSRGILFLCGLLKGADGGMLILNAETYEEAESHVLRDPFIVNNCYKRYVINEIIEANAGNNYLL